MSKNNFEIELGRKLRNMEAPVDPAVWATIASRISTNVPPSSGGMGFATGIAAGVVLLAGLSIYSNLKTEDLPSVVTAVAVVVSDMPNTVNEGMTGQLVASPNSSQNPIPENLESQPVAPSESSEKKRIEDAEPEKVRNEITELQPSPVQAIPKKEAPANLKNPAVVESGTVVNQNTTSAKTESTQISASIKANFLSGYTPLIVNFDNNGYAEYHHWDFGIKGKSDSKEATVVYDEPGIYTAYLNVEDSEGNTRTDMVTINVKEGSNLVAPDSFTPNGDGLNDTYKVEGLHIADFHLTIVNSKGKPVFETHNINTGWEFEPNVHAGNGEFYIAVVKARGVDGKDYSFFKKLNIIY